MFRAARLRVRHGLAGVSRRQGWHGAGDRVACVLWRGHAMRWPRRTISAYRPGDGRQLECGIQLACWLRLVRYRRSIFVADLGPLAVRTLVLHVAPVWLAQVYHPIEDTD